MNCVTYDHNILAAIKQLYGHFFTSVHPSVTPFNNVPVIVSSWNLQEAIEVMTTFSRFRTGNPAWIHLWRWNDPQSLMLLRRVTVSFFQGHPSHFKVTRLKESPILTQIGRFWTVIPVWIHQWLYEPCMIVPHKYSKICWSATAN